MVAFTKNKFVAVHWALTLFLAPCFLWIIDCVESHRIALPGPEEFWLFMAFGAVFSLPALVVYFLVVHAVLGPGRQFGPVKLILNAVVIVSICATLLIVLDGSLFPDLVFPYCLAAIIASLPLNFRNTTGS